MMKPKEGTPNKAKIKSAGRMLKNAGFNVLGTLTKEEAHEDLTSPDRKGGYGYIEAVSYTHLTLPTNREV